VRLSDLLAKAREVLNLSGRVGQNVISFRVPQEVWLAYHALSDEAKETLRKGLILNILEGFLGLRNLEEGFTVVLPKHRSIHVVYAESGDLCEERLKVVEAELEVYRRKARVYEEKARELEEKLSQVQPDTAAAEMERLLNQALNLLEEVFTPGRLADAQVRRTLMARALQLIEMVRGSDYVGKVKERWGFVKR